MNPLARNSDTGVRQVEADSLTPAMRQYVEQKQRVGDAVLLFRMGDFYETFYDDAVLCARVLGIALTSRSKGDNPIPLAGIPYHALDGYLRKLVAAGHRVAVSEQLEDPKEAKGVIRRDIVRIVTAGTLTEDSILAERDASLLASLCVSGSQAGLAWVDLASGRFEVADVSCGSALDELVRLRPAELIIDDERGGEAERLGQQLREMIPCALGRRSTFDFGAHQAQRALLDHFQCASLAGFGFESMSPALCAAGAVIQYLSETQKSTMPHVVSLRRREFGEFLRMDHGSFRALEIERTLRSGSREGSLLHAVDRTVHPIGARRLKQWLCTPLCTAEPILARHDAVGRLVERGELRARIRGELKGLADIERVVARIALNRANPRDLAGLMRTLDRLPKIAAAVAETECYGLAPQLQASRPAESSRSDHPSEPEPPGPHALSAIASDLTGLDGLASVLKGAVIDDPPLSSREGGFIAAGFDAELDRLRGIGQDGRGWLAEFQRREIERTGLGHLRVGYNRVFGYYIELPHSAAEKVPPEYIRRQTVKNAERYITDELKRYETEVLTAQDRAFELEYNIFVRLCEAVKAQIPLLVRAADGLGRLDCLAALAELAVERRYVRPALSDDGRLEIRDGRHPVLDQVLGERFVPNDTVLTSNDAPVVVITGPNMAGKSTYIRQTALIALLAQAGSFVPARSMTWSLVDRIFARVGSADELMRGQSTFMVEMTEAANILHNATAHSLVVLDELGRGTSTFDGLSLAWAITEHLATAIRCRTMVATHYHELTELAELLKGVRNLNVAVREYPGAQRQSDGVAFLHRIVEGGASKSYGIHVAALAGIPKPVIQRSKEILAELEEGFERESRSPQLSRKKTKETTQLQLFRNLEAELMEALRTIDPQTTTPLEALQTLSDWKTRFGR